MEPADLLSQTIDKSELPPLHQKRILAFINHFVISSCNFLNDFAVNCESKFIDLERKIQKIDAALTILEAKLNSIPDAENASESKEQITTHSSVPPNHSASNIQSTPVVTTGTTSVSTEGESHLDNTISETNGVKACEDLRYKKFFKMVQFGVPPAAIKLKMKVEGISPDILDTPNAILPDGITS